ncbi:alpha/beta fold hydrolase [Pseudonocardia sp. NPDC049154]|uniref:alpha/beta hydrolase n=1 Tax=Pseudonocardia sp. NPDC049154 TaxID=3155501 RepID=UPI00340630B7
MPGTTYDHDYWDVGYRPDAYSWTRAMVAAGYAVLLYDRTGTGESDRPPAAEVTLEAHSSVLSQLVGTARRGSGTIGPHARVVTAGHSLGSLIMLDEAVRHRDVDGVVVTGFLHTPNPVGLPAALVSTQVPVELDARWRGRAPFGYTTTPAGMRRTAFHSDTAELAAVSLDEQTKSTSTLAELGPGLPNYAALVAAGIGMLTVPALVAVGERDLPFCAVRCGTAQVESERALWSPEAQVEVQVVPGAGHDLTMDRAAPDHFASTVEWLDRRIRAGR